MVDPALIGAFMVNPLPKPVPISSTQPVWGKIFPDGWNRKARDQMLKKFSVCHSHGGDPSL